MKNMTVNVYAPLPPTLANFVGSVLTHSLNKRVSGYGTLCPRLNAFAEFILYMQLLTNLMSEGTSDTRTTLGDIAERF